MAPPQSFKYVQVAKDYMKGMTHDELVEKYGRSKKTIYAYIAKARTLGIIPRPDRNPYNKAMYNYRNTGLRMGAMRDIFEALEKNQFQYLIEDVGEGELIADAIARAVTLAYTVNGHRRHPHTAPGMPLVLNEEAEQTEKERLYDGLKNIAYGDPDRPGWMLRKAARIILGDERPRFMDKHRKTGKRKRRLTAKNRNAD